MNVVILRGSPLKKGITNSIVEKLFKKYDFNVKYYDAYDCNIKACIACNYCFSHENECVIKDEFQTMINDIDKADLVVLASPLHFSSYTGKLLSMISRFQYLFALKYHHKKPIRFKEKYGIAVITGGNNYSEMFDAVKIVDKLIFDHINTKEVKRLEIKETDKHSVENLINIYNDEIKEINNFIMNIEKNSY